MHDFQKMISPFFNKPFEIMAELKYKTIIQLQTFETKSKLRLEMVFSLLYINKMLIK